MCQITLKLESSLQSTLDHKNIEKSKRNWWIFTNASILALDKKVRCQLSVTKLWQLHSITFCLLNFWRGVQQNKTERNHRVERKWIRSHAVKNNQNAALTWSWSRSRKWKKVTSCTFVYWKPKPRRNKIVNERDSFQFFTYINQGK